MSPKPLLSSVSFLVQSTLLVLATTTLGRAVSIAIPNFSFEQGSLAGWTPGDTNDPRAGQYEAIYPDTNGFSAAEGTYAAYIYATANTSTYLISAASLATIAVNTQYTLTVSIGYDISKTIEARNSLSAEIGLMADNVNIPESVLTGIMPIDTSLTTKTMTDYSVGFSTFNGSNASLIGKSLTLFLGQAASGIANVYPVPSFDNVRLDATAVPESSTYALCGGLASLAWAFIARRRTR